MKRLIIRITLGVAALAVLGLGLFALRNTELDKAGSALIGEDRGAEALQRLKPLAYLGDGMAQSTVGDVYARGWGGVAKNDAEAIYWFRRAGLGGNFAFGGDIDPAAQAELEVAVDYANGTNGVKVDPVESLKWLKRAAKRGSKEAAAMLRQSPR